MPYSAPAGDAVEFEFDPSILGIEGAVPKLYLSDLAGTKSNVLSINRATLNASGLTAARIQTLQDRAGAIALVDDMAVRLPGRLTLESGIAVSTTNQTAKTNVYYTLYNGVLVPIWDGTEFGYHQIAELNLALDSDSGHTGYHQSGKNFDLFVANVGGTVRLGTGPAWATDTSRGTGAGTTEIERKEGIWTNKNSMTLRWGSASGDTTTVSVNHGTYVGTMRASANGQCDDSLMGRLLWNMYNRVLRALHVLEGTDSWTYSTAAWRQMNGSTANQVAMVRGLDEDSVAVTAGVASITTDTAGAASMVCGVGLDSATAIAANSVISSVTISTAGIGNNALISQYSGFPGLGYHFLAGLEHGHGGGTQTWYGDAGIAGKFQSGLVGSCRA